MVMGPTGIAGVGTTVPLNRPAAVEEIAHVVAFVASPDASYATGSMFASGTRVAPCTLCF